MVEVGVDVPNATVMMIEHAERFGLAQLHQLRGRVGRSGHQSYCLLMASGGVLLRSAKPQAAGEPASAARERLDALVRSTDGFVIAEEDLRIRGPGEFFGFRQWGMPEFRVANLVRDADILQQARQEAFALLKQDPQLKAPVHGPCERRCWRRWEAKLDLGVDQLRFGGLSSTSPNRPRTPPGVGTPLRAVGLPGRRHPLKRNAQP